MGVVFIWVWGASNLSTGARKVFAEQSRGFVTTRDGQGQSRTARTHCRYKGGKHFHHSEKHADSTAYLSPNLHPKSRFPPDHRLSSTGQGHRKMRIQFDSTG